MVDRSRVAEFTGSCACLRPAPQHLGIFIPAAPGPEGRVRTSRRMSAKKLATDRHPPVGAARCDVFREAWIP